MKNILRLVLVCIGMALAVPSFAQSPIFPQNPFSLGFEIVSADGSYYLFENIPPPPHFASASGLYVWDPGVMQPMGVDLDPSMSYDSVNFVLRFSLTPVMTFNNTASHSIQTVAASGNGFTLSSTQNALVNYSISITTSVSLSGNASGYVVLEICPTNSSTAASWLEIGRSPSGQSGTLVVGLTLTQVGGGQIGGAVPAGYYSRLRSVNVSGTPTYAYNSGQEVLLP